MTEDFSAATVQKMGALNEYFNRMRDIKKNITAESLVSSGVVRRVRGGIRLLATFVTSPRSKRRNGKLADWR